MIEISPLQQIQQADLERVGGGYISDSKYAIRYEESDEEVTLALQQVPLAQPYHKIFPYDDPETMERYERVVQMGYSWGAFEGDTLVGVLLAEPQEWNRTVWVWEFHVAEGYRGRGLGRRLMEQIAAQARESGYRTLVCETQNTNAAAIQIYRQLGFRAEGIDLSYYTNEDYPDGEVAIFMKRRLI